MPALIINVNNEKKGAILEAIPGKVVIIGRDEECDVALPEAVGLSRQHCSITYTEEGFKLKDLGSTNGTYADAVKVEKETILKEGVKYTIGNADFHVMGLGLVNLLKKATNQEQPAEPEDKKKDDKPTAPKPTPQEKEAPAPRLKSKTKGSVARWKARMALLKKLSPVTKDVSNSSVHIIEILLVLVITFYGGLALYNFLHGGSLLPPFID